MNLLRYRDYVVARYTTLRAVLVRYIGERTEKGLNRSIPCLRSLGSVLNAQTA